MAPCVVLTALFSDGAVGLVDAAGPLSFGGCRHSSAATTRPVRLRRVVASAGCRRAAANFAQVTVIDAVTHGVYVPPRT